MAGSLYLYLVSDLGKSTQRKNSKKDSALPEKSSISLSRKIEATCNKDFLLIDSLKKSLKHFQHYLEGAEIEVDDRSLKSEEILSNHGGSLSNLLLLKCVFDSHSNSNNQDFDTFVKSIQYVLSMIPCDFRWSLISTYAPEIINSYQGVYALATDLGCHEKIVNHLKTLFYDDNGDIERDIKQKMQVCGYVARSIRPLSRQEVGEILCKDIGIWFIKNSEKMLAMSANSATVGIHNKTLIDLICKTPSLINEFWINALREKINVRFHALTKSLIQKNSEYIRNHKDYRYARSLISAAVNKNILLVPLLNPAQDSFMIQLEIMCSALNNSNINNRFQAWRIIYDLIVSEKIKDSSKLREMQSLLRSSLGSFSEADYKKAKKMVAKLR